MNSPDQDTRDIAKGALINFSGVIAKSINVIFLIVLARFYGLEVTGMFILARAGFEILSKLGALGLDRSLLSLLSRHLVESKAEITDKAYCILGQGLFIGVAVTLVIFLSAQGLIGLLAGGIFAQQEVVASLRIIICAALFSTITAVFLAATRAQRVMHYEVIVKSVVEPAVLFILSVLFYFQDFGFKGLCLAFLLSAAVGSIVATFFFKQFFSLQRTLANVFNFKRLAKFFTYTLPVGVHDVLNLLLQRIDLFLVERFLSPIFVGIYGVAQEIASVLKAPQQSFEPIFIPIIAGTYQRGDRAVMRQQYQNVSRWVMLITGGLFGFMYITIRPIAALFGAEFPIPPAVFGLFGLGLLINGTMGLGESILLIKRPAINMANTGVAILINLCLGLFLIPKFGLYGAALGTLLTYTVLNVSRVVEIYVFYRIQPFTRHHLKILLALILSGLSAVFVQYFSASSLHFDLITGLLFLLLYALLLASLGAAPEGRMIVSKLISRLKPGYKTGLSKSSEI